MMSVFALKDLINKPIEEVTFSLKSLKELDEVSKSLSMDGETLIRIEFTDHKNHFKFQLKKRRNIHRKTINLLRNKEISAIIC